MAADRVRQQKIIVVEPDNVIAARFGDAAIARQRGAGVLFVDIADARVAETADDIGGMVGRGIVDHDYLQMGIILIHSALDRQFKEVGPVMRRNDDAYERHRTAVGMP